MTPVTISDPLRARGRALGLLALVLLALLGPLALRAVIEGRAELRAAADASTPDATIVHLGRAARWRLPIADHDERAREQLEQLATRAERESDAALALVAWRELRGALLGTRTWAIVDPEQLARANAGIVRAMVEQAHASGREAAADRWQAELDAPPAREDLGTRLAALAFVLWLASLVGFVLRGLDGQGRLARRWIAWALASVALLLAWLLAM